ncbi:hypothetical protein HBB16_09390 [Pseudonocardia sp. MCCB 268]|nr:hypothetical protein [Pseudonocardia cytotoxica]
MAKTLESIDLGRPGVPPTTRRRPVRQVPTPAVPVTPRPALAGRARPISRRQAVAARITGTLRQQVTWRADSGRAGPHRRWRGSRGERFIGRFRWRAAIRWRCTCWR